MGMNPTTIFIVIPFILLLVTILYRYTVNGNEVNENMTEDMRNRSRIQRRRRRQRRENRRLRRAAEKERLMKEKQQAAQGETNTNPLFENNPTYNSIIS
jgi:hypothetical protein